MIIKKKSKVTGYAAPISDEPTPQQILEAINVLKRAGVNISANVNAVTENTAQNTVNTNNTATVQNYENRNPSQYINSEYETINMMLGNGNNNNNNDPLMNMLPYMLDKNKEGKNIDPQVIQSLMMNSMMNGLNGLNSTDNR